MNRAFRTFLTAFVVPSAVAAGSALLMFQFLLSRHLDSTAEDQMAWIRDATRLVAERYYKEVSPEQLAYDAIRGLASRDRWSGFIDPEDEARYREETEGNYVGIGFAVHLEGPPLTVLYPFPGSPTAQAGIETGDRIVGVDGQDLEGQSGDAIVSRIKLKDGEGVPVRIRVRPWTAPGEPARPEYEVEVVRASIQTASAVDARLLDAARGIGYVRLKAFQERSSAELARELGTLATQGMTALILDLRGNRGGFLEQAVGVTSLFLEDAEVLRTVGRAPDASQVYRTTGDGNGGAAPYRGLPLVVLVDNESASASEIVAGALQDHERALLVGERTFGKGFVQSLIPQLYVVGGEARTARLKITTSQYFTPAGRAIGEDAAAEIHGDSPTGLWPDLLVEVQDAAESAWLERYLADREIPEETWARIRERCPGRRQIEEAEDGFADHQLRAALDLLRGGKLVNRLR